MAIRMRYYQLRTFCRWRQWMLRPSGLHASMTRKSCKGTLATQKATMEDLHCFSTSKCSRETTICPIEIFRVACGVSRKNGCMHPQCLYLGGVSHNMPTSDLICLFGSPLLPAFMAGPPRLSKWTSSSIDVMILGNKNETTVMLCLSSAFELLTAASKCEPGLLGRLINGAVFHESRLTLALSQLPLCLRITNKHGNDVC